MRNLKAKTFARLSLISVLPLIFAQPTLAQSAPQSDVSPTVQTLRRHMLDAQVNALTFRSMDRLFTTRTVARSGAVAPLPRADRALDFTYSFEGQTYSPDAFLERTFTNAMIVMKDGKIVSEVYRNLSDEKSRFMAWSMTKSITALLIGAALRDQKIKSVDDAITDYLPELKTGAYNGVSIKAILQMRSGVDYEERYDFENPGIAARNHESALVQNVARFADTARTIKRAHAPGSHFQYKTIDTAVLGWLIERVTGTSVAAYTAQQLWEPIGAQADAYYIMDGAPGVGREFSGAGLNATARDFARIGMLLLNEGKVGDRQVIPTDFVRTATAPSHAENAQGGYGYQFWTAPNSDAYYALGLQGQFIFVDPKTKTVIVKLSYFPPADMKADAETRAFMAAASAWTAR